jgi:hypothetical protein
LSGDLLYNGFVSDYAKETAERDFKTIDMMFRANRDQIAQRIAADQLISPV